MYQGLEWNEIGNAGRWFRGVGRTLLSTVRI